MDRRRDTLNTKKRDVKILTKLTLWDSQHFSPIMLHEDLEPIMSKLGFIAGPILPPSLPLPGAVSWRTYAYVSSCRWMKKLQDGEKPPSLKLPYPRIDGLHELTYAAFLDAVNFYLEKDDISTIFHVRGLSVYNVDLTGTWETEPEMGRYIYRPRTLDIKKSSLPLILNERDQNDDDDEMIRRKRRTRGSSPGIVVPLKDIITIMGSNSL